MDFHRVTVIAAIILYDYAYNVVFAYTNYIELMALLAYGVYFIWFVITQFKIYKDIDSLDNQIDKMSRGEEFDEAIPETSPYSATAASFRRFPKMSRRP